MLVKIGNKIGGLPEVDKYPETVAPALSKVLDRDDWSLRDIYEASEMIEQMPVVKEVVLELLKLLPTKREKV
mgnify:CR=1 FL=1